MRLSPATTVGSTFDSASLVMGVTAAEVIWGSVRLWLFGKLMLPQQRESLQLCLMGSARRDRARPSPAGIQEPGGHRVARVRRQPSQSESGRAWSPGQYPRDTA